MSNRMYDCVFCINDGKCDHWDRTDHLYNLRDGTSDCFKPHGRTVPPWYNPFNEVCYMCKEHSYEVCSKCEKMTDKCYGCKEHSSKKCAECRR